jgi:hypothetical protein
MQQRVKTRSRSYLCRLANAKVTVNWRVRALRRKVQLSLLREKLVLQNMLALWRELCARELLANELLLRLRRTRS